jgi:hypothetical protein
MKPSATRGAGLFAAISLLFLAGPGGCGHSSFDFVTDQANMESGGAGGSLPPMGSGGQSPPPGGGAPNVPSVGGFFPGGGSFGGEGGAPNCIGPGCPEERCCQTIDVTCAPFEGWCVYCSDQNQCGEGFSCDPLTDQCLPECTDHDSCPNPLPLCDPFRGVCTQCSENVHCTPGTSCVKGFCVPCEYCH